MVGGGAALRVEGVSAGASGWVEDAGEKVLPVLDALRPLLPGGLRRGTTVLAESTSLALAVAAGAARSEEVWLAGLGLPSVGLVAAGQLGVPLGRLVMVAAPQDGRAWATAAATLVDAFAVVLLGSRRVGPQVARRLVARARDKGAVLVVVGTRRSWPEAPDVHLSMADGEWEGPRGEGAGFLTRRRVEVDAEGRRGASRPRRATLWLPDGAGGAATAEPERRADRLGETMAPTRSSDGYFYVGSPEEESAPTRWAALSTVAPTRRGA